MVDEAPAAMDPWQALRWQVLRIGLAPRLPLPRTGSALNVLNGLLKSVKTGQDADPQRPAVKRAFHLPHAAAHRFRWRAGEAFPLEILFFGGDAASVENWLNDFSQYLATTPKANFDLAGVHGIGERRGGERRGGELLAEAASPPPHAELEFLTPLPFKRAPGARRTELPLELFLKQLAQRVKSLFDIELAPPPAPGVQLQHWYWDYMEFQHHAKSEPGHRQYYNGCVGSLYFQGPLQTLLPWLRLAEAIHAGGSVALNGQGHCRLHTPARPRFDPKLAQPGTWSAALAGVQEAHDDWAAELAAEYGAPFDESEFCRRLAQRLAQPDWQPAPSQCFSVPKRDGVRRLEKPPLTELVAHTGLYQLLRVPLGRALKPAATDCRHEQESAIEDFFPSVDLERMQALLDALLPPADQALRRVLRGLLHTPYVENGALRARRQGLAQGSPLSPLLAKLYLDQFDAEIAYVI